MKYKPFLNISPGEFIKEELTAHGWTRKDLANRLGMSLKSAGSLIQGRQTIDACAAKRLSKVFGQSPKYWMNLDASYRFWLKTRVSEWVPGKYWVEKI